MPADISFDTNSYSYLEAPWHKLGVVSEVPMGAVEAFSTMQTMFYEKRPVKVFLNGKEHETSQFAIVRSPVPSDAQERIVGYVTEDYKIVQPLDICQSFDDNVGVHVETLGTLGTNCDRMFLTWKLPKIVVGKDDEILPFGFVAAGMDGVHGLALYNTFIRVVCSNTWKQAVDQSQAKGTIFSTRHINKNALRDLGIFMSHLQNKALKKANAASEIFNRMAEVYVKDEEAKSLIKEIYPDPKELPADYPEQLRKEKQPGINEKKFEATVQRNVMFRLFKEREWDGSPDTKDTAWALFNTITWFENYGHEDRRDPSYSLVLGRRSEVMEKAQNVISNWMVAK